MLKIFCLLFIASLLPSAAFAQTSDSILSQKAIPFDDKSELSELAGLITQQRLVLLGEASHGTSEFYTKRAFLSRHLIEEQDFNFIAVEGDWASFSRINEFVKHKENGPATLEEAMESFTRWPPWMWRNQEFKNLVEWLHQFNASLPMSERVGLYGIDVYDHEAAMDDVTAWISSVDSAKGRESAGLYSCMSRHNEPVDYIRMIAQTGQDCSEDISDVLEIVRSLEHHPDSDPWSFFKAEQGAKVALNAELHYRSNLYQGSRGVIWAHNTHIGDARATDMAIHSMHNIGQLSREALGAENVFAIGFGTYTGRVLAGSSWGDEMQAMTTPEAQPDTWEYTLEQTGHPRFFLDLRDEELASALSERIPHRAIGVTYDPSNEQNNYVPTVLPQRYDAFIFIRDTDVLSPLD